MDSAVQQSLALTSSKHANHGLFADHFLNAHDRLRRMPEWQQATGVEEARQKILRLYRKQASRLTHRANEPQTEKHFIHPVLDLLWGKDEYEVQVRIPNVDERRQPDYAFFRTADERREADKRKGTLEYFREVPALGDAKAWKASLNRQTRSDKSPSAQICNYLYRSGVRWGILTNGRLWRLYEHEKSRPGDIYYEVNLVDLLDRPDGESFKHFYLFFRREAFVPDPQTGLCFVEKVLHESAKYATEIGDSLKESVYDALRHLMNGFLAHRANGLDASDPDTVRLAHDNCLILLYRILFILYAEHRGILPCENPQFSEYSLRKLHQEINHKLLRGAYAISPTTLWPRLCSVFKLIDEGFVERGRTIVPAYNGGLFSPEKHPYIAYESPSGAKQWQIGDRYLAEAIDLLAYKRERWDRPTSDTLDYATLDVQHLGSIYEGLLELQPHVAAEPLIETAEKGKSVFKPARDVAAARPIRGQPPRLIQGSEVYLVTNRGERKATGSYYTPKYIVDYIVENTVGPVAEEAAKKVAELRPDVDDKIKKLERARRGWEKSSARDAPEHIAGLNKLIEEQKRRLLEPYLSLKILDPAMGSGHFLVGAADRLSQEMATDPNLIPPGETDSENPQAFYKRLIVERCLYGVDLNPLAVELAKLSLWLHTVSKGKALSFLDHHLRCGNSLIGARIEDDLMKYPPHLDARGKLKRLEEDLVSGVQEALYAGPLAQILELLHKISEIPTQDAATEKMKEGLYAELEKAREKFRAVANCWLAPYFGVRVEFDQYQRAVSALRRSAAEWQAIGDEPWFCAAQAAAQQKHFFHWELEFPEVFFAPHGFKPKDQRGFDVVIGNPPWVSFGLRGVGKLIDDEETFYRERLSESAQYKISMYAMFIERGLSVSKFGGYHGFIVPDSFLLGQYFSDVRRCILSHSFIEGIALILEDFWESGDVGRNVVYILNKQSPETTKSRHIMTVLMAETLQDFGQHKWRAHSYPQMHFEQLHLNRFRLFCSLQQEVFVRRVESAEVVTAGRIMSIHTGVRSKVGQKNVTSKMAKGLSWKKGLTSSASVTRYGVLWDGDYINIVPALLWAGGWDSDVVNQPKILIRQTGDRIIAGIDRDKLYHLNNIHAAVLHDVSIRLGYVLSLLNSKLMFKYYTLISLEFERAMAQTDIETLEQLPIRRIAFTTPKAERERLVEEGKALCERTISAMTQGVK